METVNPLGSRNLISEVNGSLPLSVLQLLCLIVELQEMSGCEYNHLDLSSDVRTFNRNSAVNF